MTGPAVGPGGEAEMTETGVIAEAESALRTSAETLTNPLEGECLLCFVVRMTDTLGCDNTLRWALRYRDLRAPHDRRLEQRLEELGGFCDCEIVVNGYALATELMVSDPDADDLSVPDEQPACLGVVPATTEPCGVWRLVGGW